MSEAKQIIDLVENWARTQDDDGETLKNLREYVAKGLEKLTEPVTVLCEACGCDERECADYHEYERLEREDELFRSLEAGTKPVKVKTKEWLLVRPE